MDQNHVGRTGERKVGWPEGDDDVINKYGTYEVQRTCGVENDYPQIAQGLSAKEAGTLERRAERWRKKTGK